MKSTNYYDTFLAVAEDCPAKSGEIPPHDRGAKTVANLQYDLLHDAPYQHTSDDVVFHVYAAKNHVAQKAAAAERETFFAKGQPCLRCSPLAKRYGWGLHFDSAGRIAIYGVESKEYAKLAREQQLKQIKGMRSKRA